MAEAGAIDALQALTESEDDTTGAVPCIPSTVCLDLLSASEFVSVIRRTRLYFCMHMHRSGGHESSLFPAKL